MRIQRPSPNYLSRIRRPKPIIESIVKTLEAKKIEEPDIELFVEAVLEDAEEADEVIIEETVVESIIEAILIAAEGVEAVLEATGEIFRIKAAARHTIVFRPR